MSDIYIHAGPGKTGTSAIQAWCNDNSDYLLSRGIYYPTHRTDINKISSGNLTELLSHKVGEGWQLDKNKVEALLSLAASNKYRAIVISSEFLFDHIESIYHLIPNAQFIVYLRAPLEQALSAYNQGVKREGKIHCFNNCQLKFPMLDCLDGLLANNKQLKLMIKPYAFDLFKHGELVDDFLACLDLSRKKEKKQDINASYCYEAMEFKRFSNHFDLSKNLDNKLDLALQVYPLGTKSYSLSPMKFRLELAELSCDALTSFMNKYPYYKLNEFKQYLSCSMTDAPYIEQNKISYKDLALVGDYLRNEHPDVYQNLTEIVSTSPSVLLPNIAYFKCFDTDIREYFVQPKVSYIDDMASKIASQKFDSKVEVCKSISAYFEQQGETKKALEFMEVAYYFRPEGDFIRAKVKEYRSVLQENKISSKFERFIKSLKKIISIR